MNRRSLFSWAFILFAALLCSACGGSDDSSSSSSSNTYVRLVNATQVNNLKLTVSSTTSASGISSGSASDYASMTAATYSAIVSVDDGSLSTSSSTSLTMSADTYYSVVAYARGGQIKLLILTDTVSTPATGFAALTIANAGTDAGNVDVYTVSPGTSVTSDMSPTFSSVSAGSSSLTNSISAGTYDIVVTASSKPNDVRLTMSSVTLTSTEVATLTLTSTSGGSLVDGAMIQQKGAVQLYPANKARVRVVAAFAAGTANPTVAASIGGTTLNSVTAPSIGTYTLVPANSSTYTVGVNGVTLGTLPSQIFASGGDYSILVFGTDVNSASVEVLTDNNQLPSSGAKIRLINGAVSTAGISLSANYVPLFSEQSYGTASDYVGITTGSTLFQLTSPVTAFSSYSATVTVLSGGVYSLFVLGNTTSAIEVLSKDK
ncbi:MAG: DUF4397 domain-containing protein [Steroidobacteraceae bacterium]